MFYSYSYIEPLPSTFRMVDFLDSLHDPETCLLRERLLQELSREHQELTQSGLLHLLQASRLTRFLQGNMGSVEEAAAHFRRMLDWYKEAWWEAFVAVGRSSRWLFRSFWKAFEVIEWPSEGSKRAHEAEMESKRLLIEGKEWSVDSVEGGRELFRMMCIDASKTTQDGTMRPVKQAPLISGRLRSSSYRRAI